MTPPTDFPVVVEQGGLLSGMGGDLLIQILAGLAVAALSFFLGFDRGKASNTTINGDVNITNIYNVVRHYASDARSAGSNELKHKAEVLERKIEEYLGPLMVLGRDLAALTKALRQAGDGKVDEPAKPDPRPEAKPETHKTCGCGGHGTPKGCICPPQTFSINQVYIGGAPVMTQPHGHNEPHRSHDEGKTGDKPTPPKTVKRDMTHQEQIDALDKAVRAFNDYWLNKDGRVSELKAAQGALNRRPSSSDLSGATGHHFGNRH